MTTLIPKHKQTATGAVNRSISQKLDEIPSLSDFDTNANYEAYALTLTQPVDHAVKPETVIRTLSSKLKDIVSVLDFGAVADGNSVTGAGTNNSPFFQAAINALGYGGVLYIPAGTYQLHTQITVPEFFTITGAGQQTILTCPTAFNSDGLFKFNGTGGPPASIENVFISAQVGGAGASSVGLNLATNGTSGRNLWIGGFATQVELRSSSVFLYDSVIDTGISSSLGIRITSGATIVDNVQVYNNSTGVLVNAIFGDGPVTISNIQCVQCDSSGINISSSENVQVINCSAASSVPAFNGYGILVDASTKVTISNFIGRLATKSTVGKGIRISASSDVSISNSIFHFWNYGIEVLNSSSIIVDGNISSDNKVYGIYSSGGDRISITNNVCIANGDVSASSAGIYANNTAGNSLYTVLGNTCTQTGGGVQKYGIDANLTNNGASSGFTNLVGNMAKFNTTANINTTGLVANISSTGNVS